MTAVDEQHHRTEDLADLDSSHFKEVATTRRNVVVVMPFGDEDADRRRAILNFTRLKYIIEDKCRVVPKLAIPAGAQVAYDVIVASTAMNNIPKVALKKIGDADIVVALLTERNYNVAFELGFRRALGKKVIVVSKSPAELPIYEADVAFQDWKEETVLEEIEHIVDLDFTKLADFDVDIPDALRSAIDARDGTLIAGLQKALKETEDEFVAPLPDSVQKLRAMLSDAIHRFYPSSVVEVRFSQKGQFEDSESPATVVEFDEKFASLYGYVNRDVARKDGPLSLGLLLGRICQFADSDNWQEFIREQNHLTDVVIKGYALARATVPIKFNSTHPDPWFADRTILPCMTAQVIDGDLAGPHKMYLLVEYIEIKDVVTPTCGGSRQ